MVRRGVPSGLTLRDGGRAAAAAAAAPWRARAAGGGALEPVNPVNPCGVCKTAWPRGHGSTWGGRGIQGEEGWGGLGVWAAGAGPRTRGLFGRRRGLKRKRAGARGRRPGARALWRGRPRRPRPRELRAGACPGGAQGREGAAERGRAPGVRGAPRCVACAGQAGMLGGMLEPARRRGHGTGAIAARRHGARAGRAGGLLRGWRAAGGTGGSPKRVPGERENWAVPGRR
jgi:hypothetical protein